MSRMPAKYRLISRLDHDQAIQAFEEGTNEKLGVCFLAQTCAEAGTPATIELPEGGISMQHGEDRRDFSGTHSVVRARQPYPYDNNFARITIMANGIFWETEIHLLHHTLWFSPAIVEAQIDRFWGISAETGELQQLQHELVQERDARKSLEVVLTALREKPLHTGERTSFERLLYVLAREAKLELKKPFSDGLAIIRAAELLGVKVPSDDTIAKLLKAAKARAESDQKSE
jgi:hypothetical protein